MFTSQVAFRGVLYKFSLLQDYPCHPSWWTFQDEADVRNDTWLVSPGDIVLDVGAAYGSYTMAALAAGAAHVVAWVPQVAQEATLFRQTLELNGWTDRCTLVTDYGIYDRDGWIDVDTQQVLDAPTQSTGCIKVKPLDEWYLVQPPIAPILSNRRRLWLKIDVEGAEVQVIEGAKKLIGDLRPIIQVENHLFRRQSIADEVKAAIEPLGYQMTYYRPYGVAVSHSVFYPI